VSDAKLTLPKTLTVSQLGLTYAASAENVRTESKKYAHLLTLSSRTIGFSSFVLQNYGVTFSITCR